MKLTNEMKNSKTLKRGFI